MGSNSLTHWGIRGMRWGVRRYQNEDGSLTPAGRERYGEPGSGETRSKGGSRWKKIAKGAAIGLGAAAAVGGAAYLYNRHRRNGGSRLGLPSGRLGLPSPNSTALAVRGNNSIANIGSRAIGAARTRPGMEYVGRKVREERGNFRDKFRGAVGNARKFAGKHSEDIGLGVENAGYLATTGMSIAGMVNTRKMNKLKRQIRAAKNRGEKPDPKAVEEYKRLNKKNTKLLAASVITYLGAQPLGKLATSGANSFAKGGTNRILNDYKDFTVSDITDLVPTGGNELMIRRR